MNSFQEHFQYIIKNSLARTNRFQVIIPLPQALLSNISSTQQEKTSPYYGNDIIKPVSSSPSGTEATRGLQIMVESTDIPGKNITTSDIKYNGDFIKIPYSNVYETQQFMFRCSRDMYEKNIIDDWMNLIYDPVEHFIGYLDEYATNIIINQMNEKDEVVYSVVLKDAYPTMCTPITVSHEDKDAYARLQCTFMYRRWIREEDNLTTSNLSVNDYQRNRRTRPKTFTAADLKRRKRNNRDLSLVDSLSQTPFGPVLAPYLSNPAIQRTLDLIEDKTGLDLEGEAVNVYNNVSSIVKNTTGKSLNKSVSAIEAIKAQVGVSGTMSGTQKADVIDTIDNVLNNLRS